MCTSFESLFQGRKAGGRAASETPSKRAKNTRGALGVGKTTCGAISFALAEFRQGFTGEIDPLALTSPPASFGAPLTTLSALG